jgi:hypothetical protein
MAVENFDAGILVGRDQYESDHSACYKRVEVNVVRENGTGTPGMILL